MNRFGILLLTLVLTISSSLMGCATTENNRSADANNSKDRIERNQAHPRMDRV